MFKIFALILLNSFTIITTKNPIYPIEQTLQHIGTLFIVLILIWDIRKKMFDFLGFSCILLFGIILVLGVRYIYSYVSYQEFFLDFFQFDFNSYFEFTRKHYDKLLHFSFGLLFLLAIFQWIKIKSSLSYICSLIVAWLVLQNFSLLNELLERLFSIQMSEQEAENYNGQQGDLWDSQKDMSLAM